MKQIEGYPGYAITPFGDVFSFKSSKYLKQTKGKNGYLQVSLCADGKQKKVEVHLLVARTFIPNPDNKEIVNHKDGNKHNPKVCNLEWVTRKENTAHALQTGLRKRQCAIERAVIIVTPENEKQVFINMKDASLYFGKNRNWVFDRIKKSSTFYHGDIMIMVLETGQAVPDVQYVPPGGKEEIAI
jgi:hypothetical protein